MLEGFIAGKLANKMFEDDVFKIVKRHAFWGALIMMIPDFGCGTIVFAFVLWHMYHKICKKVGFKFSWSIVGAGVIVNIVVALVIDIVFVFLMPLIIIQGFIVYAQFYLSGKAFIETLKRIK